MVDVEMAGAGGGKPISIHLGIVMMVNSLFLGSQ